MSTYPIRTIKDKLKSKLESISSINQVMYYPNHDFSGYPSAVIRHSDGTSIRETTSENFEEYRFSIYLFQDINTEVKTIMEWYEVMEDLIDEVRDSFDNDEFLSGITMSTNRTMLGTMPVGWNIGEEENGKYIIGELIITIQVNKLNT